MDKLYTFAFSGQISVVASSEAEAFDKVDDLLGYTAYINDNSEDYSIDDIECVDEEDIEED